MKKLLVIISVLVIVFTLLGCRDGRENKINKNIIGSCDLIDNIYYMQNEDGGYCEIKDEKLSYIPLYHTYYSLKTLTSLEYDFPEKYRDKLIFKMENVNINDILTKTTYDDISNSYFFLKIADIVGYENNLELKQKILLEVSRLQNDKGFFYRSLKEEENYNNGLLKYESDSSINLVTMTYAINILAPHNKDLLNEAFLKQWLEDISTKLDYIDVDSQSLATIVTVMNIVDLLKIESKMYVNDNALKSLYKKWLSHLKESPPTQINMITLENVFQLGRYLSNNSKDISINEKDFLEYVRRYKCKDGGYSNEPSGGSHILFTYLAANIIKEFGFSIQERSEIIEYVNSRINFDGTYLPSENSDSQIFASYYAFELLNNYLDDSNFPNKKFNSYIRESLDKGLSYYSTPKALMLLKLSKVCQPNLSEDLIYEYLDKQLNKASEVEYGQNRMLILLLLETSNIYNYTYDDILKEYLTNKSKKEDETFFENKTLEIINKCIDLEIRYVVNQDKSLISQNEINHLLDLYVNQYDELEDKIYCTYWLVKCFENLNIEATIFPDYIKLKIIDEISSNSSYGFVAYSSNDYLSFESSVAANKILNYMTK